MVGLCRFVAAGRGAPAACGIISAVDEPAAPLDGDELDELQRGVYERGTDEFSRVLSWLLILPASRLADRIKAKGVAA
jgi:hypothetical protein